jgi:MFS family permease
MLPTLRSLLPLFLAEGLLLAGGGVIATILSISGARAGFGPTMIGLIGTGYFAGYLVGCFVNPRLVKSVGHIRVFAAYSAIAGSSTLLFVLFVEPTVWIAVRALAGFCFSGLFMVMEGWINSASTNQTRARIFSIFRMVDMTFVAAGQFLMPIVGLEGLAIYAIISIVTCISVVPVALGDRSNPRPPEDMVLNLPAIWKISPLACGGCLFVGLTNTAFRLIAPIYVADIGFSLSRVASFISIAIVASAILQLPLGWLSDRVDRRIAVMLASAGAVLAAVTLAFAPPTMPWLLFAGSFVYGGLSLPLYPLLAAHANDRAHPGQYVVVAAGLSTFFSIGAIAGPLIASQLLSLFGALGLFGFLAVTQLGMLGLASYRYIAERGRTS